jgi:hypothetical protein
MKWQGVCHDGSIIVGWGQTDGGRKVKSNWFSEATLIALTERLIAKLLPGRRESVAYHGESSYPKSHLKFANPLSVKASNTRPRTVVTAEAATRLPRAERGLSR